MNYTFLFWAYNIIWLLIASYMTFLLVKIARLERDVKRLEDKASQLKRQ